ncbi:pectin lyase fold/virulence factor [Emericellopsis atlantica]|uniref:pectate lyase n=1 Tax=Emericellopsis atlantica TaxID=2614577 RepID=A0A9P7ZSC7_9HYPO|nr:pectin lyase fold/virulence factor [Emericellopsis atlantica]KAG9256922.1 pectin lyase fold/virulence factor [Emericellopsis atlantica]
MKSFALAALVGLAVASPTPTVDKSDKRTIQKRASITEAANIGFASSNGGTTGGAGGTTTTVTDYASFSEAASADGPAVIVVQGDLTGPGRIRPSSDKTIVGASGGASLTGIGFYVRRVSNVIIRNLAIAKVDADDGDAIGIDGSTNVWVDHVDLSGDLNVGKDDYDGLFDVTHASDWITLSNSVLHDHWKASLVGHSDSNGDEDTGHLTVTYANNRWSNINSRGPSVRFGTVHVYNNAYEHMIDSAINTRLGAQVLVESTTFTDTDKPIIFRDSDETGYVVVNDVDLGGASYDVAEGTLSGSDLPYSYQLAGSGNLESVLAGAGATLTWA